MSDNGFKGLAENIIMIKSPFLRPEEMEKLAAKRKEPVGCIGSTAHVVSNDKIEDKFETISEINKEASKTMGKLGTISLASAGAAGLASKYTKKGSEFAQKSLGKLGSFLDKVNVKSDVIKIFINPDNTAKCSRGVVHTSLKEMLSDTKLGQKFVKSSMPTKAAAAAGLGVLLLGLPLAMLSSASKAGYIEAKHEKK